MVLVTNIVIDQTLGIATMSVTQSGNTVENINYTHANNQVTFGLRPDISITFTEFLDFAAQIIIFETAIIFNFNPNVFLTSPFYSANNTESHDSILNKWNLVCIYGATPRVCNYSADKASFLILLANRSGPKTLEFAEWLYWLIILDHYSKSIKGF